LDRLEVDPECGQGIGIDPGRAGGDTRPERQLGPTPRPSNERARAGKPSASRRVQKMRIDVSRTPILLMAPLGLVFVTALLPASVVGANELPAPTVLMTPS